jgi:TRAP transporter TAXI family solute receptor
MEKTISGIGKSKSVIIFSVFLCILVAFSAGYATAQEKIVKWKVAAARPGTSYYAYSAPMGDLVNQYSKDPKIELTVSTSGGGIVNIGYLSAKETEIACCQTGNAWLAVNGMDPFKEKIDLRAIVVAEQAPFFFVVAADSNIKSVADIVGKKVVPGAPGSGTAVVFQKTTDALGLKIKESDTVYLSWAEGKDALADGRVDVWFSFLSANLDALAAKRKIRLISLSDAEVEKISKEVPYVPKMLFPAGVVQGVDKPTVTISTKALWVCRSDADPNVIYEIVKSIIEHKEVIQKSHRNSRMFDAKFAASETLIPYHEGALKYYKEVGAR